MKQQGLLHFTDINLTVVAMLLFMFAFGVIALWAWTKKNRAHFERMSKLPLDDNQGETR